jgi:transposase-like protein
MGDTHFIRVIVQGYDRLTNVVRDAANKSGPALDGMRNKWRDQKRASDDANISLKNFAETASRGQGLDKARTKVDRLSDSITKLRQKLRGGLIPRQEADFFKESPEQMFARLGRESGGARRAGRFVSQPDFIADESRETTGGPKRRRPSC